MLAVITRSLYVRFSVTSWTFECYAVTNPAYLIYGVNVISAEPTSCARNSAVKQAREHGLSGNDILVQVDDDMVPAAGWYARMLQVFTELSGPMAVGSPYCGGAPSRDVNVKRLDGLRYSREEAAACRKVEQVACIGTGLLAANMEAFDVIEKANLVPWFDYEYTDKYHARPSCTEDFFFCKRLNQAGGRVFCDWESWSGHDKREVSGKPGADLSYSFTRIEPVPLPRPIPIGVRGCMWPHELVWLYEQAQQNGVPGDLLEIGSYCGLSAAALAQAGKLTCVDTFAGGGEMPERDSFEDFHNNMWMMGLFPQVIRDHSEVALPILPDASYRLIFVDGGHARKQVEADLRNSWRLLAPGGLLVVDDFTVPSQMMNGLFGTFPEVTGACIDFARSLGLAFAPAPNSKMGYLRKPKLEV